MGMSYQGGSGSNEAVKGHCSQARTKPLPYRRPGWLRANRCQTGGTNETKAAIYFEWDVAGRSCDSIKTNPASRFRRYGSRYRHDARGGFLTFYPCVSAETQIHAAYRHRPISLFGNLRYWSGATLSAAGAKAVAAKNRPAGLRFERHAVRLPALVAHDFETLAVRPAATLFRSAKVGAPRVAAGLAALGMTQPAFAIIILFSFSEWEGAATLGASDFQVRHSVSREISSRQLVV